MKRVVETPSSVCLFGIARDDITPPVGIYHRMWGAARHDQSAGVHRPLTATAVLIREASDGERKTGQQLWIALDHCLLSQAEVDAIRNSASRRSGVAVDSIVVVFSHTHAAGLMMRDRADLPGGDLIPAYLDAVQSTVAKLAADVTKSMVEATISYGRGRCELAAQRDLWDDTTEQWVCGFNPSGEADDTVLVARVTDSKGSTVATIVNYACHPTTLAWDNQLISPDYPGAMREVVERETGAPCVFLQGASGDLGPRHGFVGDAGVADRNGMQLGHAALSALNALGPPSSHFTYAGPVVSGATIGTWEYVPLPENRIADLKKWSLLDEQIPIDYRADLPRKEEVIRERTQLMVDEAAARERGEQARAADLRALVERKTRLLARLESLPPGDRFPFFVSVTRVGGAVWIAVQGEPYQILQTSLRARFPNTPIIVATIANGWGPSYLPPAELYGKGIYQETIAVLEAGSLEYLIEHVGDLIDRCLKH